MNKLRALEAFVNTVRTGSFSSAGKVLGLSPASASRYLDDLEESLGVRLLNRSTRNLSMTEAGQLYVKQVESILQSLRDADDSVSSLAKTPSGTLHIQSRVLFGTVMLTPLLPEFQRLYPQLKIQLNITEQTAISPDDEVDVYLRIGRPADSGMMMKRILQSERMLVASPGYLASRPKLEAPEDLQHHNCLCYFHIDVDKPVWRFKLREKLTEITVPCSFSTNNGRVLHQLACLGHGIALLDHYTVQKDLEAGRLVRLLPEYKATNTIFDSDIFALYRPTPYLPAKVRAFLDFIAERIR